MNSDCFGTKHIQNVYEVVVVLVILKIILLAEKLEAFNKSSTIEHEQSLALMI